jgi:hypothetical protein
MPPQISTVQIELVPGRPDRYSITVLRTDIHFNNAVRAIERLDAVENVVHADESSRNLVVEFNGAWDLMTATKQIGGAVRALPAS